MYSPYCRSEKARVKSGCAPWMSGRVPLGFTLEGEPLVTRPALDAYVAALLGSVSEPAQRSRVMSAWNLSCVLRRKLGVLAAGVCPFCWLHQPDCVCASLPKPFTPVFCDAAGSCTLRHNDIKVTLVLHPREVGTRPYASLSAAAPHACLLRVVLAVYARVQHGALCGARAAARCASGCVGTFQPRLQVRGTGGTLCCILCEHVCEYFVGRCLSFE